MTIYQFDISTIIYILIIHFLADFGLQTGDQAVNKYKSNLYLFYHVGMYSLVWLFAMYGYTGLLLPSILFAAITFVCHFATDYVTSKISHKFFEEKDFHNGFVTVGFDQVLHYCQLLFTFILLVEKIK